LSNGAEEALQRARAHLQQATLEGLEAARALVQAAMHTSGLAGASADSLVSNVQRSLEELIAALRENGTFILPAVLAEPLAAALEAQIERWEQRSRTDPDARPVLRAFLGLRELLWELGLRREPPPREPPSKGKRSPPSSESRDPARPKRDRVQRFDVED
jgi:hypothetical protein